MSDNVIRIADRIKEISYTTGTTNFSLSGPVNGFAPFSSSFSDGDNLFYAITDGTNYEVGSGTYILNFGNPELIRFPIKSSNSNSFVDFPAGIKEVYVTYPATNAVYTGSGIDSLNTPTTNSIAVWASPNTLHCDPEFVWDADYKRLGINYATPDYGLHLGGDGVGSMIKASGLIMNAYGIYFPPANNGDINYAGGTQLTHYEKNELDDVAFASGFIGELTGSSSVIALSGTSNQFILFKKQDAGLVFAGPASGCTPPCSPAFPTFRQLTLEDVPAITEVSGVLNNKIFFLVGTANSTTLSVSGILNNKINAVSGVAATPLPDGDKGDILVTNNGTTWTIDSLSVSTGKIANGAVSSPKLSFNLSSIANGRLTLESNNPVSVTDQTSKTIVYYTPYNGSSIALYNTSTGFWEIVNFTQTSLSLGTLVSGKNYDVFGYLSNGSLALEFGTAWASDTARFTGLSLQNGIYCKTGDLSRRYLGTIRTTSTTTTEDSLSKRFVWNVNNKVQREVYKETAAGPWTYSTASWRAVNSTNYNVEIVNGLVGQIINLNAGILFAAPQAGTVLFYYLAIAKNTSVTPLIGTRVQSVNDSVQTQLSVQLIENPAIGYHYYYPIELTSSTTAATLYGSNAGTYFGGIQGTWEC